MERIGKKSKDMLGQEPGHKSGHMLKSFSIDLKDNLKTIPPNNRIFLLVISSKTPSLYKKLTKIKRQVI